MVQEYLEKLEPTMIVRNNVMFQRVSNNDFYTFCFIVINSSLFINKKILNISY